MDLDKIVEAVKAGIRAAGGTPVTFPAIAVCDGIAMGHVGMKYSLVDPGPHCRLHRGHGHWPTSLTGWCMVPNCDKNVPGLLMAAARLNIPTIFCSGGPMLAGRLEDGRRTCLSHMFEAVGAYHAGTAGRGGGAGVRGERLSQLRLLLRHVYRQLHELPDRGHWHGSARQRDHSRAVYCPARRLAKQAGMQIMELVRRDIRPRDIMTPAAFHNAETVDMALGCSTNTMLHLPAIAHEAGVEH